ncbi:PTS sugar transporter subunit IIB [Olsenella sp. HMSC062G07]|uniref:PTS sugar transporter subunit IIB n=1 Tax=Olsenella sp. HMSC062G07 TaxID=1739330 RepID=UPI0008A399D9|nr:PTS sugar transporter subunit IIB [Olsenella sp. HMSC062G07]OFK23963.1 PTS galactitol transporter subunit IIB [Olsenella sp. HMSC062G07]
MKTILIICGAGHATSTVVRSKISRWLESEGLDSQVQIKQSSVTREVENISNDMYDIVVTTTQVPDAIQNRVINGIALLTGIGADAVFTQIKNELGK